MKEIIANDYLVTLKDNIKREIASAQKQNQTFKENGLYPDYNMNDIILNLQDQLEYIDNILKMSESDYNKLYPPIQNADTLLLVDELQVQEKNLADDLAGTTLLMDAMTEEYQSTSDTIDLLLSHTTKQHPLEEMTTQLKETLHLPEEEIIHNFE